MKEFNKSNAPLKLQSSFLTMTILIIMFKEICINATILYDNDMSHCAGGWSYLISNL